MKRVIAILVISCSLQLTLASDTQHRFRVFVDVIGDDKQAVNTIEIHLKRELRLLGDVDIVGVDGDWVFIIEVACMALKWKNGTKAGGFAIASRPAVRLSKSAYLDPADYKFQATIFGTLTAAYDQRESLPQYCIETVGRFDKDYLQTLRSRYKK